VTCFSKDIVVVMGSYSRLLSKLCTAYADWVILFCMSHMVLVSLLSTITGLSNVRYFMCGTCEFVNPTFCMFMYNTVCFWFCKFIYGVGTLEGYYHQFAWTNSWSCILMGYVMYKSSKFSYFGLYHYPGHDIIVL